MRIYTAALSGDEYESYRSPSLAEEKVLKCMRILLSGRELRIGEDTYALFESVNGGFEVVDVVEKYKIVNCMMDFAGVTTMFNNMNDLELEEQYFNFCAGESLQSMKRKR